jgi:competence protein ComEC
MTASAEISREPTSFSRQPMPVLAASFSAGILIAKFTAVDVRASVAVCAIAAVTALVFRSKGIATAMIAAAFAAAGMIASHTEQASIRPDRIKVLYDSGNVASGSVVEVEGTLASSPEPAFDGVFLDLAADELRFHGEERSVTGSVRIFVAQEDPNLRSELSDLKYGSRARVACRMTREDQYLNPGVVTKREVLDRQAIDAVCTVKDERLIEHIADESVFVPAAWVHASRGTLIDAFRQNLEPQTAGVMIASLLGDKYFLDRGTADTFREGGTFHILVISGLHITFIGGLLLLLIRRLTRKRWLQFAATVAILWAYTIAVGADVPVVRASVMFTVLLFSYAIYRTSTLLNSLGVCALVLLVWRPSDLFNPSFQLTFVSVAAIVACAYPLVEKMRAIGTWTPTASRPFPPNVPSRLRRFCETIYWNSDAWTIESKRQIWTAKLFKSPHFGERGIANGRAAIRYTFEAALVSSVVQLWMLPLTIVYFHRVSLAGVLLNIWVGAFIAIESFAAMIGAVCALCSSLMARPFFTIADILNWMMLSVPRLFSDNGWASFRLPAYSHAGLVFYFLYFLPLVFFAVALAKWKPFDLGASSRSVRQRTLALTAAVFTALLAIIIFHPLSAPAADGRLHVDFIDVGQGDSALVTFPNGTTLLVDGGGRSDYRRVSEGEDAFEPDTMSIGEAVVSRVLWDRGYSSIDHILATHADADHVEGLADVARNFKIGSAIFGRIPSNDPDLAELLGVLEQRGIATEIVSRGDRYKFGDATVEVLYPLIADEADAISDNDHSIVLRIVYGTRSILLTGDIEQGAERTLLDSGGTLTADVMKVPHHGSRTSSTQGFVDAVGAQYAVISVGRSSPFGHPHAEVVERLKRSGAQVLITGTSGMISVSTDGRDLQTATFAK